MECGERGADESWRVTWDASACKGRRGTCPRGTLGAGGLPGGPAHASPPSPLLQFFILFADDACPSPVPCVRPREHRSWFGKTQGQVTTIPSLLHPQILIEGLLSPGQSARF